MRENEAADCGDDHVRHQYNFRDKDRRVIPMTVEIRIADDQDRPEQKQRGEERCEQ